MVVLRIALAGLALLVVNACRPETDDQKAARRAIDAVLAERFTLARLTNQSSWQPCDAPDTVLVVVRVRCGQSPPPGTAQFDRLASATRLFRIARTDSTPLTLRAGALLELRWHSSSPGAIDRAIASLERARRRDSTGAVVLNDLAVSYLEKGQRDQDLQPMIRALDAVERALDRDSTLTAALFNRALILDRLYLIESARRAWSRYLDIEKDGRWRTEAEAHARRFAVGADRSSLAQVASLAADGEDSLRAELMTLVRRSPQTARDLSFTLLSDWGAALGRGDETRAAT